ncbi:MAG: YkgJ family cysteine cluster protein [Desulfovibrio sp.]
MSEAAFDCRMCGHCCEGKGGIILTPKDTTRLAAHLEMDEQAMLEKYAEDLNGKPCIIVGEDNFCVFFKEGKGCGIHPGRPDVCRAWPFFRGNLVDEDSWKMIQEYCPGVNPNVPHEAFVKEGREYIAQEDLLKKDVGTAPNALTPED